MARKKRKPKIALSARLNIVIHPALKNWVKDYAARKHTSVTAIITDRFVELKERDEDCDVEQI